MNLLRDPLLRTDLAGTVKVLTLPELLTALGEDAVDHLPGLQRYQEDALHVFLSYLAATVLDRLHQTSPQQSEAFWQQGLRLLAGESGDEAWTLVVRELDRPAFMQPPLPPGDQLKLHLKAETPDALDLLITSQDHDLKQQRAHQAYADEWIYALISLQTMSGYLGHGNPEISRMHGGYGNRPIIELVRSRRFGGRWRDAVLRLLDYRPMVLAAGYGYDPQGQVLIWNEPWDGSTMLALSALDPFYIEICRRVRLTSGPTGLKALAVPSSACRIDAKSRQGVVGDAWTPIDSSQPQRLKVLSIPSRGFTASFLRRLVFNDQVQLTPLYYPASDWAGDAWLVASVLIHGQGRTEGFHECHLRIPNSAERRWLGPTIRQDSLAALSQSMMEYVGTMQDAVLRPAIASYLEVGKGNLAQSAQVSYLWWSRWAGRFDDLWTDAYFPWLWRAEAPFGPWLTGWAAQLRDWAWQVLTEAEQVMPHQAGRGYRNGLAAARAFDSALYAPKHFPFLKEARYEHLPAR